MISLLIFIFILVFCITLRFWQLNANLLHWLKHQLHYLYLIRIPLIGGVILFAFPIIAQFLAPQFLANLFVVESQPQLVIVMVFATLIATSIVSLIKSILVSIHQELNESNFFRVLRTILTFCLFTPIWISLAYNSLLKNEDLTIQWSSFFLGVILSSLWLIIVFIYDWRRYFCVMRNNYFSSNLKKKRTLYAGISTIIVINFYIVTIILNWPNNQRIVNEIWQAPTLLYAILIIWLMTLIIGGINYYFDQSAVETYSQPIDTSILYTFQFPTILLLILISFLSYRLFGVDHFFKLQDANSAVSQNINYEEDFKKALGNRLCQDDFQKTKSCQTEQTLVVVATSGGGIQASGWTAQVLAGLQDKTWGIGEDFTQKIGLISSVSGGSVGTMFYLDQFENGLLPKSALDLDKNLKINNVVKNATDDWLDSVGWGLAFPDLFRLMGYPLVLFSENNKYLDRGYSLEKDWQRTLKKNETTLDDWYSKAIKGEIPIPVFNSTIVENGRRFLISPLKFLPGQMSDYLNLSQVNFLESNAQQTKQIKQSRAFDFRTLYNNCGYSNNQMCTVEVTTAARLSASFPYVSPTPRNDRNNILHLIKDNIDQEIIQNYHTADGGYFDNAGAFTALEWLNTLLEKNPELKIKKVVLLQINAFPEDALKLQQRGNNGFFTVIKGPLNALNGVRNSTQIARNINEIQLIKNRWNDGRINIQEFTITFPKQDFEGNKYNQPLSWRLTQTQKKNLTKAWESDKSIRTTVECMNEFWKSQEGKMNNPKCEFL